MFFVRFIEKLTHRIAHLSTNKLAILFAFVLITAVGVGLLPQPPKPTPKPSRDTTPSSQQTNQGPVLNQSINSAESLGQSSTKEVGISVGESLLPLSDQDLNTRLSDFKNLGVTWIRADLSWSSVQSDGPYSYDWSRFDRLVNTAESQGFKVLPILAYTPPWGRPTGCNSDKCAPEPGRFAQFANAAAHRYKLKGIHTWEIWNEPNMTGFWQPRPDPSAYVDLLRAVTVTIRNCDPSASIISGSLGSTDPSGGVPQLDFLSAIYKYGGKNYFDAVGFHPYSFPVLPADYYIWNAWSQIAQTPISIRSIMVANGDTAKNIWITEFGAPTGGPGAIATSTNYNLGAHPDHVDEALQAKMVSSAFTDFKANPFESKLFWYSYQDLGSSGSTENFYGLRKSNGSPKPSYQAFKDSVASLSH